MIRTDNEFANMVNSLVAKSESTVVDYKALLCLDNDAEKAEFLKDFVGFANTVMLKGTPSYILFGYDEKKGEYFNIFASQIPGKEFKRWWNPEESVERNISNVTNLISQLIRIDNIKPIPPLYDPEFGKLDVEVKNKEGKKISKQVLVGYLKIYPSFYPETPYHICNENYVKKLNNNKYFYRNNESVTRIEEEEVKNIITPANKIAYISPKDLKNHITSLTTGNFYKAGEGLDAEIPLSIHNSDKDPIDHIDALLQEHSKIIILADIGNGKTTLVKKYVYHKAKAFFENFDKRQFLSMIDEELLFETKDLPLIPIYIPLNIMLNDVEQLEQEVCQVISHEMADMKETRIVHKFDHFYNKKNMKWLLVLDGMDEVENREQALKILTSWIRRLPEQVKVIVTTRPYTINPSEIFKVIHINPLNKTQILSYCRQKLLQEFFHQQFDIEEVLDEIEKNFYKNQDLNLLFNNFRTLDGFIGLLTGIIGGTENLVPPALVVSASHQDDIEMETKPGEKTIDLLADPDAFIYQDETVQLTATPERIDISFDYESYDIDHAQRIRFPKTGIIVKKVIDHLREVEEGKRVNISLGDQLVNKTFYKLQSFAWGHDWDEERFNYLHFCGSENYSEQYFLCAENIGFIKKISSDFHRFQSPLIHYFFIADYAYKTEQGNEIEQRQCHSKPYIKDLFDDFQELYEKEEEPIICPIQP